MAEQAMIPHAGTAAELAQLLGLGLQQIRQGVKRIELEIADYAIMELGRAELEQFSGRMRAMIAAAEAAGLTVEQRRDMARMCDVYIIRPAPALAAAIDAEIISDPAPNEEPEHGSG